MDLYSEVYIGVTETVLKCCDPKSCGTCEVVLRNLSFTHTLIRSPYSSYIPLFTLYVLIKVLMINKISWVKTYITFIVVQVRCTDTHQCGAKIHLGMSTSEFVHLDCFFSTMSHIGIQQSVWSYSSGLSYNDNVVSGRWYRSSNATSSPGAPHKFGNVSSPHFCAYNFLREGR